ncbi:MAG: hypothetical protein RKO25_01585 [Candidatus Contendobacter sp.]|nr:hypothetical protein [Candidatus Contendobacter sp.]
MTTAPVEKDCKKANGLFQLALQYHRQERFDEAAWLYQKIIEIFSRFYSKDLQAVECASTNLNALTQKIENLHPVRPKELQIGDPLLDDHEPVSLDPTVPATPSPLTISSPPTVKNTAPPNSMRRAMGPTRVTVRVENLARSGKPYENEFLVDTRAIDCLAPASALQQAGVVVEGRDFYETANGEVREYAYGFAFISFMGSKTVAQIIFGPEDVEPILGVTALENAGIGIDPVARTLKRMVAKPLEKIARMNKARRGPG